jgi:hypothetical protein
MALFLVPEIFPLEKGGTSDEKDILIARIKFSLGRG